MNVKIRRVSGIHLGFTLRRDIQDHDQQQKSLTFPRSSSNPPRLLLPRWDQLGACRFPASMVLGPNNTGKLYRFGAEMNQLYMYRRLRVGTIYISSRICCSFTRYILYMYIIFFN